jgi:hypothetical protein
MFFMVHLLRESVIGFAASFITTCLGDIILVMMHSGSSLVAALLLSIGVGTGRRRRLAFFSSYP